MNLPPLPEMLETLALLPGWEHRYTYVIELARRLPPMAEAEKVAANLVPGCTAQVWLAHGWEGEGLRLSLASDALIVQGLLAIVHAAYHGRTRAQIVATDLPALLEPSGLLHHLSPNRRSGFVAVVGRIRALGQG